MDGDSSQGLEFKDLYISARQEVLENYQKEMHCKVSKYLCESFNNIPKLTKNNDIVK